LLSFTVKDDIAKAFSIIHASCVAESDVDADRVISGWWFMDANYEKEGEIVITPDENGIPINVKVGDESNSDTFNQALIFATKLRKWFLGQENPNTTADLFGMCESITRLCDIYYHYLGDSVNADGMYEMAFEIEKVISRAVEGFVEVKEIEDYSMDNIKSHFNGIMNRFEELSEKEGKERFKGLKFSDVSGEE